MSTPKKDLPDLERDLYGSTVIRGKIQDSEVYAQHLYAALCNNCFQKKQVIAVLQNKTWSCSWRWAGEIVSALANGDGYMDWYCSGIATRRSGFVSEGTVVEEIQQDLDQLGWVVINCPP